jgi:hypothetical protein
MAKPVLVTLVSAVAAISASTAGRWGGCDSDLDCSLNGDCNSDGKCICDSAWTGPACAQLNLGKAPTTPALYRDNTSTWGLSIIQDEDGNYHGFAAAFYGHCGLDSWQSNSLLWHVRSTSATGPFVNETVVAAANDETPYFRHNPTIVLHKPTNTFVLSHIGCGNGTIQTRFSNCSGGFTPGQATLSDETANSERSVGVGPCGGYNSNALVSTSIDGPWKQVGLTEPPPGAPWPNSEDNPSPLVLPNGTVWIMFRSYNGTHGSPTHSVIGIARSQGSSWSDNYTSPTHPILGSGANGDAAPYAQLEDPFFWKDARGYKALFHTMGGCESVGCFAFSEDSYTWHTTPQTVDGLGYAYTNTVSFTNGTTHTFERRERPHLVFASDGVTPVALTNGVRPFSANDHTYSLVVPFA